jgi:hypothetical protein
MKIISKTIKALGIGIIAVILVTIGIDASDHFDNMSESIVGRVFFGENEGLCPEGMTHILNDAGGFCIDIYEASPDKNCPYINPKSQEETRSNLNLDSCKAVSVEGVIPWSFVSQAQAQVACAKAGKRLVTAEEWYLASLGTPDLSENWTYDDCHVNNNWENQPGETGTGVKCVSSYGVYDMIGNVWEWVGGELNEGFLEDKKIPESGYINSVDSKGVPVKTNANNPDLNYNEDYLWTKDSGIRGLTRGGYWNSKTDAGIYAMYSAFDPSYVGSGIGFRCAK